jgi:thiol-disulfide isomerase/thioredoxin
VDPALLRLLAVAGIIAAATLAGRWWQARDGQVSDAATDAPRMAREQLAALGVTTDGTAAVLFGSPTCAPCDTVKDLLREVEADEPDFRWTYVDAADHLELADEHRIRRVPTLLVLDRDGTVTSRTSGVPARDELRRAVRPAAAA